MIGKIREIVKSILEEEKKDKIVILAPSMLGEETPPPGEDMRLVGVFCDV